MFTRALRRTAPPFLCLFAVAGCNVFTDRTNTEPALFRATSTGQTSLTITDAKQRVIFERSRPVPGVALPAGATSQPASSSDTIPVICAEPSPDVAQSISDAVKFGLEVAKAGAGPDGKSATASLSLATAVSASVAQLGERLAVIQLLRDKMYRACEAYANRSVDKVGYTLMLARLDKTMATMLSSEIAAGAFGRGLAATGGSAAAAGADPADIAEAQRNVVEASNKVKEAAAEQDDTKRPTKVAEAGAALDEAVKKLATLEFRSARAAALADAGSSPGSITGRGAIAAAEIASIHRTYMDDDGTEPLIDACISALSDSRNLTDIQEKNLTDIRRRIANAEASVRINEPADSARLSANQAYQSSRLGPALRARDEAYGDLQAAYSAYVSPFAGFCVSEVLSGKRYGHVDDRLYQKRELRKIEAGAANSAARQRELAAEVIKAKMELCTNEVKLMAAAKGDVKKAREECYKSSGLQAAAEGQ